MKDNKINIVDKIKFPDHYRYSEQTLKSLINKAKKNLKIGGYLYLEIGNGQSRKICHMLKKNNFRVVKKLMDYTKEIRCIIGTRLK